MYVTVCCLCMYKEDGDSSSVDELSTDVSITQLRLFDVRFFVLLPVVGPLLVGSCRRSLWRSQECELGPPLSSPLLLLPFPSPLPSPF